MKYMTTKEASIKWKISDRRIRALLHANRIEGAEKIGRNWMIPLNAAKPIDLREKRGDQFLGLNAYFNEVDSLQKKINGKRPLNSATLKSLHESLIVDWTYNSNAIEGSTLTLAETKVVLEGITIGGRSVREHLEAINHKEAILFLEELVKSKAPLTEWDIKSLHALILRNIDDLNAGKYRLSNVIISGATHIPPQYDKLPSLMETLVIDFNKQWHKYHPLAQAVLLHGEFVKIHPFVDGNGRTARLLLNLVLMNNGYTPIVIRKENRLNYYEALDKAHTTGDYSDFLDLIKKLVIESSNRLLSLI